MLGVTNLVNERVQKARAGEYPEVKFRCEQRWSSQNIEKANENERYDVLNVIQVVPETKSKVVISLVYRRPVSS